MNVHGVAAAARRAALEGSGNASDDFWLDEQAFIVFGRQVETPVVRSGNVTLLLDHRQSRAVEHKPGMPLMKEPQWLKRYCEIKGSLLLYAPHSDAAFEGAFLLEDFAFKLLAPSRALIAGVRRHQEIHRRGLRFPATASFPLRLGRQMSLVIQLPGV